MQTIISKHLEKNLDFQISPTYSQKWKINKNSEISWLDLTTRNVGLSYKKIRAVGVKKHGTIM